MRRFMNNSDQQAAQDVGLTNKKTFNIKKFFLMINASFDNILIFFYFSEFFKTFCQIEFVS